MRLFAALLATATAVVFPGAAAAGPIIDRAVDALAGDPVYVDAGAERAIDEEEAGRLRERISEAGAGPLYVAILPAAAADEAGGSPDEALRQLIRGLRRDGTYAVVVGNAFRAGSDQVDAAPLATEALREHGGEGVTPTLLAFVDAVGEARAGGGSEPAADPAGDGGGGLGTFVIPLLAVGGIGFFLYRRRQRRAVENAELAEVKEVARDDLVALGDDIRELDLDVEMPGVTKEARADYERALTMYERADRALDNARSVEQLEQVSSAVEEGRWSIASVRARLEGREPPERRPPCFFDPRHGPSDRDVEWAPPWGEPRVVPACEADAQRVERGDDPEAREVMVGGRPTPYWNAGPAYGPWAGGFFGGFGGLFPGILLGSMLGGAFMAPMAYGSGGEGGEGGGDGGFGDFGGGDFGDFGGGDFGGGDFGGGDF
jgi:hypothetical protein